MSDYRLEIPANVWHHQSADGLSALVRILTQLQITGYTVTREETPKPAPPAPEVRIVKEFVSVYQCPECPYNSQSQNSVNSHRKVHAR